MMGITDGMEMKAMRCGQCHQSGDEARLSFLFKAFAFQRQ
jgi:hypothetical protein